MLAVSIFALAVAVSCSAKTYVLLQRLERFNIYAVIDHAEFERIVDLPHERLGFLIQKASYP